jgi:capsular polysaccharide transport system permease protein
LNGNDLMHTVKSLNVSERFNTGRIKTHRLFICTVVLPTLLSILYFGFIASDVYTSESTFVVRSPERQSEAPLSGILKGVGFSRAQDDAYTVQNFMRSRDALRVLNEKLAIGKAFANNDVDIISRFAALGWNDSFEALYRYYLKKVDIQYDSASSIFTVTVRAFTAEDCYRINKLLLEMSETLINSLNERGRQDMIRFAAGEVSEAEGKAKTAELALSSFRSQKGVIDPERQSTIQLQQISKLQDELIATKTQLVHLQTFTRENPQIPALKKRVETLQSEIKNESARVTGGENSLAGKAAGYQSLALEREFTAKQLAAALASLEQARNEAIRKQLYLERIVQPNKPDVAMEPHRLKSILETFVVGLIVWGILNMLIAGVREHLG